MFGRLWGGMRDQVCQAWVDLLVRLAKGEGHVDWETGLIRKD